jgi:hypothetical protein
MGYQSQGLRSRKLDNRRPLPVYHACELEDAAEVTPVGRNMTQVSTGVEKEEEAVKSSLALVFWVFGGGLERESGARSGRDSSLFLTIVFAMFFQ